jgi:hypothetical protein
MSLISGSPCKKKTWIILCIANFNLGDQIQCFETFSTDYENAGNIRGGLCSSDGVCTCLTGERKEKRQSAEVQCYETYSTDSENEGNIRRGLCDVDG